MKIKRLTAILLLLLMLMQLMLMVSCNKNENEAETTYTVSNDTGPYDENGYLKDSLPDNLNYSNTPISILGWDAEYVEFEAKSESKGDSVDSAVFLRNATVKDRLNVDLQYTILPVDQHSSTLEKYSMSGYYFDIIATKTQGASHMTASGYLKPINQLENSCLDLEKPWWSQLLISKIKINGNLYFLTGDISTSFVQMIYCIYFNQNMVTDEKLDNPYELVKSDKWTLAKMLQMSKDAYSDIDNELGTVSIGDQLGLAGQYWDVPALLHGCGISIVEENEKGVPVISSGFKGEKTINIINDISGAITQCGIVDNGVGAFSDGRVLFLVCQSGSAGTFFQDIRFTSGVVPCPKYDEDQESYYSTVRQPITMYAFMKNLPEERIQMDTAVVECLASSAYRFTTPVIFEKNMKYMHSNNQEMTDMLTLVRDTAYFDFGRIFAADLNAVCDYPGYAMRDNVSWSIYVNQKIPSVEILLSQLYEEHFKE